MATKTTSGRNAPRNVRKDEGGRVSVREFADALSSSLNLEIRHGHDGLDNEIRSARIQKLGMALAGFRGYVHSDRIQIFGATELSFFKELSSRARLAAIQRLKENRICCIVVTKGLDVPAELGKFCDRERIPVLRSQAMSSTSTETISRYLERRLAPRMTVHGVLIEIFGLGVLILGPSGIGKSECALELVLKGHSLITDDAVEITRFGMDRLSGAGGEVLKHHMELRGLGIINIRELFGVSATGASQDIDFAVRLERWKADAEYDRLGIEQATVDYLGVSIPLIVMPVAPGRNVSTLIEVAARIHLLKQRGYQPSKEIV